MLLIWLLLLYREHLPQLKTLAAGTRTVILYESPQRITALLAELITVFGDRPAVLAREMTKLHEQIVRMPLPDIANLTFRNLWRLPYDLNESIWILMELSGYKALVDDIASGQFLKYVPPTQADVDGTTHDDPNTDPVIPDLAKEV